MAGLSSGSRGTAPVVGVTTDQKELDLVNANSPVTRASLLTLLGYVGLEKLHKLEIKCQADDGVNLATFKAGATGTAYPYAAPNGTRVHAGADVGTRIEECDNFTLIIPVGATVTAYATIGVTGIVASVN